MINMSVNNANTTEALLLILWMWNTKNHSQCGGSALSQQQAVQAIFFAALLSRPISFENVENTTDEQLNPLLKPATASSVFLIASLQVSSDECQSS